MRSWIFLLVLYFAAVAAAQPALVCPTKPASGTCDVYHYHVQLYRPDTKQFVEVSGGNQFATPTSCERARDQQVAANARVVEYFRVTREQRQYETDRIGPCHCDMTVDRTAPNYLTDLQRTAQLRAAEEGRLRVREKLLDNKLSSESEIVKGLWLDPPVTPLLAGPRLAPLPPVSPVPVLTATEDLRSTNTVDTAKPTVAALDLPLVDVSAPPPPPAPEPPQIAEGPEAQPGPSAVDASAPRAAAPPEPQAEEVLVTAPVEPEPAPANESVIASTVPEVDVISAEEAAERFVSYETERIHNIVRAASAITDENVKAKIIEACMQRIQLVSNLRLLIEGSGMRSRLAAAARDARTETERLAVIASLFGEGIRPHWAPKDAADVIFEVDPAIAAEPERALRDTTGTVTTEQKKQALYLVLAQAQQTEGQRLWLSSVVEGFLR